MSKLKLLFSEEGRRKLSPDFFVTVAFLLLATAPLFVWRVYYLATNGGLHGVYIWLICGYVILLSRCVRLGWRGESARRRGFGEEPITITDFTGLKT
ncbi:MAG: hypothetical protein Q7S05_02275 [bacterium]|nr:hypothetical protein [bacterium]